MESATGGNTEVLLLVNPLKHLAHLVFVIKPFGYEQTLNAGCTQQKVGLNWMVKLKIFMFLGSNKG